MATRKSTTSTRKRAPRTAPAPEPEVVDDYVPQGSTPCNGGNSTHVRCNGAVPATRCPDCTGVIGSHHDPDCAYKKRSAKYNADLRERLAKCDEAAEAARVAAGKATTADRERRVVERQQRAAAANGKRPSYHPVQADDPNAATPVCVKCGVPVEPSTKARSSGWKHVAGTWDASWSELRGESN